LNDEYNLYVGDQDFYSEILAKKVADDNVGIIKKSAVTSVNKALEDNKRYLKQSVHKIAESSETEVDYTAQRIAKAVIDSINMVRKDIQKERGLESIKSDLKGGKIPMFSVVRRNIPPMNPDYNPELPKCLVEMNVNAYTSIPYVNDLATIYEQITDIDKMQYMMPQEGLCRE
jgi:hypothetical protein